jgi:hypothetical protein
MQQTHDIHTEEQQDTDFQQPEDYASAVSQAWSELDLDPTLNGNPAMSPSGQTCCACY